MDNSKDNMSMYIDKINSKEHYNFDDLCSIMSFLRSENGCEWDKEQTHKSIRKNFIEETYEVIEAIDKSDFPLMREELGDVLLQVVFHSQIAKEEGNFNISDVIDELCKKLIVRHPHVFGDVTVSGSADVLKNWDAIKAKTKKLKTGSEKMQSISQSLPSLMRASKIGEKAAKIGFDFENPADAISKAKEEIAEVETALNEGNKELIAEEIGDLLLAVVNVARLAKIDSEEALYNANEKFICRIKAVEEIADDQNIKLEKADRDKKESFWQSAKQKLAKKH